MHYFVVCFFLVINFLHASSTIFPSSKDVRSMIKNVFQNNEILYHEFLNNYDEESIFDNQPEHAQSHYNSMLAKFKDDFFNPVRPKRFENVLAASEKYHHVLQPYSPKLWRSFSAPNIPNYALFAILMDTEKNIQDFAAELNRITDADPAFFYEDWLETLALLVGSDSSIKHNEFLWAAQNSPFFSEIRIGEKGQTLASLLATIFPLIYVDEEYPGTIIIPEKKPNNPEDQQITAILKKLYFSGTKITGFEGIFYLNVNDYESIRQVFKNAGYKKDLDQVKLSHESGVAYFLSTWRVLEGGFSTKKLRKEILDNFSGKQYELKPYFEYRRTRNKEQKGHSDTKQLIHKEILARFGEVSLPLLEQKIKANSEENLEQDLLIFNKIKDGSIWDEIRYEHERLAHVIFSDYEPETVTAAVHVLPAPPKKKSAPAKNANKSKTNKKKSKKNIQPKGHKEQKNLQPKQKEEKPEPTLPKLAPAHTTKKTKGKKQAKPPRNTKKSHGARPKISNNLMNDGFPLNAPKMSKSADKSLAASNASEVQAQDQALKPDSENSRPRDSINDEPSMPELLESNNEFPIEAIDPIESSLEYPPQIDVESEEFSGKFLRIKQEFFERQSQARRLFERTYPDLVAEAYLIELKELIFEAHKILEWFRIASRNETTALLPFANACWHMTQLEEINNQMDMISDALSQPFINFAIHSPLEYESDEEDEEDDFTVILDETSHR